MEIVEILGIDPSLRFTGLAKVSYNTETKEFETTCCHLIENNKKFKGTEAIKNMLLGVGEYIIPKHILEHNRLDKIVIESPSATFSNKFSSGAMIAVGHIAGGIAGIANRHFYWDDIILTRPAEWNKSKKKDVTHAKTQEILGPYETWGFEKIIKCKSKMEHILDAASIALWYLNTHYVENVHDG